MIILNEETKDNIKKGKNQRNYKCPYCNTRLPKERLITHIESQHEEMIPEKYTAARIVFNIINKKEVGHCVHCKKETEWDENTWKYKRYCSKKCSDEYSKIMKERMVNVYGKEHLLNDPNIQKSMLKNRSISGVYRFKDGGRRDYCGSYEKKLLEFMDKIMNVNSMDVMTPGPTIEYMYKGEKLFWITDLYYAPANLVFDVKDGGDNPNRREMEDYRDKQLAKEDTIKRMNKYNYIRLTDNNFQQLLLLLSELKMNMMDNDNPEYIIRVNEEFIPGTGRTDTFIVNRMMDGSFNSCYACRGNELEDWYSIMNNKLVKISSKDIPLNECHIFKYNGDGTEFINTLECNLNKEVEFNKEYFYETLTGKNILSPNQILYDENFEEVDSIYNDLNENVAIFEASISMIDDASIPILDFPIQEQFQDKYSNLELRFNWKGYFARNIHTDNTTPYVESVTELSESILNKLNNF